MKRSNSHRLADQYKDDEAAAKSAGQENDASCTRPPTLPMIPEATVEEKVHTDPMMSLLMISLTLLRRCVRTNR